MSRPSVREKIIESGMTTLHQRGFATAGIREITAAAGVPQGCFTNHFRSKDAFAVAVLDRYHRGTQEIMDATLRDPSRRPIGRLHAYFEAIAQWLEASDWRFGCLVGNMSLEASEHSESIRLKLVEISASFTDAFADVVRAGQGAGEVRTDIDCEDLAAFLLSSWQGAMMRMKVDRSPMPLHQFKGVVFTSLLGAPSGGQRVAPG